MEQRGDHMEINFEYFQIWKWIKQTKSNQTVLQTVGSEKVEEKNGVICVVSSSLHDGP